LSRLIVEAPAEVCELNLKNMEERSRRRVRDLVARLALEGLSENEIGRARISMMARSTTRSNRRPDTLMQDRICQIDENLLHRTAGPYIRVKSRKVQTEQMFSGLCLKADARCS